MGYFVRHKYTKLFQGIVLLIILLMLPWSAWAAAAESAYHFENNLAAGIMGVPALRNLTQGANGTGLTGKGQVIAVADSGLDGGTLDTLHPDIKDHLVGIKDFSGDGWADPNGHGTHIAGSIVGSGEKSEGSIKGIAPEAGLYFQATYNEKDKTLHIPSVYQLLQDAYNAPGQPRIHVNSWGASFSDGIYDWDCYSLDKFVWEHPDMVVLKSAGNGNNTAKPFVSSPGAAKNAITVGSTEGVRGVDTSSDNPNQVSGYSSRSTFDGRIKPEVMAPGTWILSTRKTIPNLTEDNYIGMYNQYYAYMSGTSMSTALTAGALALIRQYLVQHGTYPSAAQLKALLIFGTHRMSGVSSYDQGFGRVNVENILLAIEKGGLHYVDEPGIKTGDKVTYTFTSNGRPFRAILAYSDYPKTPGVGKDLVNDLDLKVIGPDGQEIYWGNGYTDGDRLNNTEEIVVNKVQKGATYTIEVTGYNVAEGPQPFALAYGSLPYYGTISEVEEDGLTFANGDTFDVTSNTNIRVVGSGNLSEKEKLKDIPVGAEGYLIFDQEGEISDIDAIYTSVTSKLQAKEGSNQLIIYDGTRWTLASGAKIYLGNKEISWAELPIDAELTLTINPSNAQVWRIDISSMPDNFPYNSLPISDKEVERAIANSTNIGKVVLSASQDEEDDKSLVLAFNADMAGDIYSNGRPVELNLPGVSVEIPASEFAKVNKSELGAQLQLRVIWQAVREQSLPSTDPLTYLRPVGKLVELRPVIVWPDGSQLVVSQFSNPVKVTITSPGGSTAGLNIQRIGTYKFNEMSRRWDFINNDFNPDTGRSSLMINKLGKFAVLEASRTFRDITEHWAKSDIEIMAARQVVRGVTPDTFRPNEVVTRGQFTAMLIRSLGLPEDPTDANFNDMNKDYWCAGAVGTGVKMGLVAGYSNGTFGPNDPITREQMAAMLVRAMRFNSSKTISGNVFQVNNYTDGDTVAPWARTSVAIVSEEGLMRGRDMYIFAPKDLTTRAEAASVMVRLLQYKVNEK